MENPYGFFFRIKVFQDVSAFRIGSLFKPLDVFKLLCSVIFTGTP